MVVAEYDYAIDYYDVFSDSARISWLTISEMEENRARFSGTFDLWLSRRYPGQKSYDPDRPDTLHFQNGQFDAFIEFE